MNLKYLILVIVFLGLGARLPAQNGPVIRSSATKNKILLGEPFELVIESSIPAGSIVRSLTIDTIPHFEFLSPPVTDTIREARGIQIKTVFSLTSFDSGHWVIPSYSLSSRIRSDAIPIDVVFTPDFDSTKPYHDIKDVIAVETKKQGNNWWYYLAGGVLLLLLAAMILRKKKKPVVKEVSSKDAYGTAIDELQRLKKNKPSSVEYYSRMVDIFRIYVEKRKGIQSMQKTTNDLVIKLQTLKPEKEKFDALVQALRMSDFVKFAKYQPTATDDEQSWMAIKNGIDELEKLS